MTNYWQYKFALNFLKYEYWREHYVYLLIKAHLIVHPEARYHARWLIPDMFERTLRNAYNWSLNFIAEYKAHMREQQSQRGSSPRLEELTPNEHTLAFPDQAGLFNPFMLDPSSIPLTNYERRIEYIADLVNLTHWAFMQQSAFAAQHSSLMPQFGNQLPYYPEHLLPAVPPLLPQPSLQLPRPLLSPPLPPIPSLSNTSTPFHPTPAQHSWIQNTNENSPADETRPESPSSLNIDPPAAHRSSPSDTPSNPGLTDSVSEHFTQSRAASFQQHTDRSYEPLPGTTASSISTSGASTSTYVQPLTAPSSESAEDSLVGGSKPRRDRAFTRTRSHASPVIRPYQSSASSTERSPSRSLESATASKYEPYPAPYFGPSTSRGFAPPTSSYDRSFIPPPTPSIDSMVAPTDAPNPSAFKPFGTQSCERSTLPSDKLPERRSEPPQAHIPKRWPIPDHIPLPLPHYTIKPSSTPLPPPMPLPTPTATVSPVYPSHMPAYSQAHMRPVQMAAQPLEYLRRPEDIPLPPPRSRREETACPLCGTHIHKPQDCPLAKQGHLRNYRKK